MSDEKSIAPSIAKSRTKSDDDLVTLSTGIRARLVPVSSATLLEAQSRIKSPPVPMWFNPDKEREEPNPNDPEYLATLVDNRQKQIMAVMDTMIMFGVELSEPVPDDDRWVKKLKLLVKQGHLDLGELDFDDEIEREFIYKKYIVVAESDYRTLSERCGLSSEEIARQAGTFPG